MTEMTDHPADVPEKLAPDVTELKRPQYRGTPGGKDGRKNTPLFCEIISSIQYATALT